MDARLLDYYNRELQYLRELGSEFAREFPKVAGRLGLDSAECADPYVERLLEGFAFLAARVQLKIDAEFPTFTRHLLEIVYPHYLAPIPSMAVVQFQPEAGRGGLEAGFAIPRGSVLLSTPGPDTQTPCEYRTAHAITLWPLELSEAEYLGGRESLASLALPELPGVEAGLRLRLRITAPGSTFDKLPLDSLPLYLHGGGEAPVRLYEHLFAHSLAVVVRPPRHPLPWQEVLDRSSIRRLGFDDEQALLPYGPPSFQGYRLLHEYCAFPDRYRFVELTGLGPVLRRCQEAELELIVLLEADSPLLEKALKTASFALFCTPAINLFPKRADRIQLTDRAAEYHVVPDRTRPLDFEVYRIANVAGLGTEAGTGQEFRPFYAADDPSHPTGRGAYYTVHRVPRLPSSHQQRGARSDYGGSEVYIALVDAQTTPYRSDLDQLALETWCTNRDLPLYMPVGQGGTDFTLEPDAPVAAVRCLAGPTRPQPSQPEGTTAWRLISHLSLNYLSLVNRDAEQGAAALRELLTLYGAAGEAPLCRQIEGIRSVTARPITRRAPLPGPIAFARGLEITVTFEEAAYEGSGIALLGAVLEAFFARYVSLNSFTETVVNSVERGEVMRWPARIGQRRML